MSDGITECGRVAVLRSVSPSSAVVDPTAAERVATELATDAAALIATERFGALLIIGGDTAAAVLGDSPRIVGGTVAPGMPWSRRVDGDGLLVITKAGGFGGPSTLVELLFGHPL